MIIKQLVSLMVGYIFTFYYYYYYYLFIYFSKKVKTMVKITAEHTNPYINARGRENNISRHRFKLFI